MNLGVNELRQLIFRLNFMGGQHEIQKKLRKMAIRTAAELRGPADRARNTIEGISRIAAFVEDEADSWMEPGDLQSGKSGAFDACDLRFWLELARQADVPAVPAREILSLSEDELSAISQKMALPDFAVGSIRRGLERVFPEASGHDAETSEDAIDRDAIIASLHDAMDDVPSGWIVRSHISGPSTLKAYAGAGVIDSGDDAARVSDDLSVGPGWVAEGNRRRIDATDTRFVDTFARGHKPRIHYLARPWMTPARRLEGPDPHRHGTPFAGKGSWPVEWRVFVENGRVTGVASYYGWASDPTPENARSALMSVQLAERIVDRARDLGLASRWMDLEIARQQDDDKPDTPAHVQEAIRRFPRDGINCTLDFIETIDGVMLLEGGPAHTPLGGGHPCAFAGHQQNQTMGAFSKCEGVALKLMDHVLLGEPTTWRPGDVTNRILSWDQARELARHT